MKPILDQFPMDLSQWLSAVGEPSYRAGQIQHWICEKRVGSFAEMTDLPQKLRDRLSDEFQLWSSSIIRHQKADDGTEKLLLELADGGRIESVLLRDGTRRTICVSTQVGCAMGCVFCASGLEGVKRNLTSAEIIEQMLLLQRLVPTDERLSHIVVMGMGEPLANLDHLLVALDFAHDPTGLGISARRITISTVGLPDAIQRLSDDGHVYHLAVSLHAPNDALRNRLVPVNKNIGLKPILKSADHYFQSSGRRLTFEYVLLANVNDRPRHAVELANLLAGRTALLNIIPYNPVAGLPYSTPSTADQRQFCAVLRRSGINFKIRQRKGDKINAACGQLRRSADDTVLLRGGGVGSLFRRTLFTW